MRGHGWGVGSQHSQALMSYERSGSFWPTPLNSPGNICLNIHKRSRPLRGVGQWWFTSAHERWEGWVSTNSQALTSVERGGSSWPSPLNSPTNGNLTDDFGSAAFEFSDIVYSSTAVGLYSLLNQAERAVCEPRLLCQGSLDAGPWESRMRTIKANPLNEFPWKHVFVAQDGSPYTLGCWALRNLSSLEFGSMWTNMVTQALTLLDTWPGESRVRMWNLIYAWEFDRIWITIWCSVKVESVCSLNPAPAGVTLCKGVRLQPCRSARSLASSSSGLPRSLRDMLRPSQSSRSLAPRSLAPRSLLPRSGGVPREMPSPAKFLRWALLADLSRRCLPMCLAIDRQLVTISFWFVLCN